MVFHDFYLLCSVWVWSHQKCQQSSDNRFSLFKVNLTSHKFVFLLIAGLECFVGIVFRTSYKHTMSYATRILIVIYIFRPLVEIACVFRPQWKIFFTGISMHPTVLFNVFGFFLLVGCGLEQYPNTSILLFEMPVSNSESKSIFENKRYESFRFGTV